ncbi:MAG: lipopolysaccharide biosynthesis protein [Bacillota bacterium]
MNNKFKQLLSNTVIFAVGNVLVKLIQLFLMTLYTSAMTTGNYGIAELMNNSVEFAMPIASLCIYEAVFRFSIDKDANHKKLLSNGINILLISFFIISIVIFISNTFIKYEYAWYFALMLFSTSLRQLLAQFARGIGHVKRFAISGVLNALMLFIFNIVFLLIFPMEIQGYLISIVLANIVSAVFILFTSKVYQYISFTYIDNKLLKTMLIFSLPQIPNMISWWITNISSRYIIIGFCGASMAGLFTAASKLPSMVNLLSTIFQQAWQFSSAKEIKENGSDKFFSDVFKIYSAFIFVACSSLIMTIPLIARALLKGDFYRSWIYIPLLLVSAALNCYSVYFGTFYIAVKKTKMAMISTMIGAVSSLLICFTTIPFIGIYGALIASVLSYLIIVLFRIIDTKKYVTINMEWPINIFSFIILLFQAIIMTTDLPYMDAISVCCFIIIFIANIVYYRNDVIRVCRSKYWVLKG